ncbi:MAG TPA: efflux RND transporter periplasmic adaptor subunit [Gemmatimonadaceae bacterium]|jgi:cobalt-zinc-cadmium efflux system membrane fusion protein|nr:efflux RND transporter periplasmic adaptor subunit [Gemmatimonadaceae bacterium]
MTTQLTRCAAGAALFVVGAACSSKEAGTVADTVASQPQALTITPEQRQRIHVVAVTATAFRPVVEATGNVAFNGDRSTQVLSPVSGPATRVIGTPGMVVHRGEPLAYVSSPDFASAVADYRKAQSGFRNAKRIADRDSALFKNDALARGELEQAQADLAAAEADVDAAVENMRALGVDEAQIQAVKDGKTTSIAAIVKAPIDGTIVEKLISDGQLLQAGSTPCFTIADLSTMWILASVFANDLPDVSIGQPADVITDASRAPIPGKVDYIASLADPGTKAVQVRIVTPNNNHALRRDMFVRVQIKSAAEHHGILVPVSSVLRDEQNLPFVFVVMGKGFGRRRITLGTRVGDTYEVSAGLAAGDQIVAEGALFLQFAETQ